MAAPRITLRLLLHHMQDMERRLSQRIDSGLSCVEKRLDGVEKRLDGVEKNVVSINHRLEWINFGADNMDKRLDEIELEFLPKRVKKLERLPKRIKKLENKVFMSKR